VEDTGFARIFAFSTNDHRSLLGENVRMMDAGTGRDDTARLLLNEEVPFGDAIIPPALQVVVHFSRHGPEFQERGFRIRESSHASDPGMFSQSRAAATMGSQRRYSSIPPGRKRKYRRR
jgi:hypothetical protein